MTKINKEYAFGSCTAVDVSVACEVAISPHEQTRTVVRLEGPLDRVQAIRVTESCGRLTIEDDGHGSGGNVVSYNVGNVRVSNVNSTVGRIIVNGVDVTGTVASEPPTKITVLLPANYAGPIDMTLVDTADATIAALGSPALRVRASGASRLHAGASVGTRVRTSGASHVDIDSASGPCDVQASGASAVTIGGGRISVLEAEASGTAHVRVDATANTANLQASGCAQVLLAHCVEKPRSHGSGVATIRVRRVG